MWWEKDLKGKGRTIEDGANYRFNMTIGFPEGVDKAEGEKWLFEKVVPILQAAPECTRVLASAVKKDINGCAMDWVLEIWFENQSGWYKVMVDDMKALEKPSWAQQDAFPFLKPYPLSLAVIIPTFMYCTPLLSESYITFPYFSVYHTNTLMSRYTKGLSPPALPQGWINNLLLSVTKKGPEDSENHTSGRFRLRYSFLSLRPNTTLWESGKIVAEPESQRLWKPRAIPSERK